MRQLLPKQQTLGQICISDVEINLDSRDDIPRILLGLQSIYKDKQTYQEVEGLLSTVLNHNQLNLGRQGMDMWRVFVLAILRLNLNCDYDRLQELANEHKSLRHILGHGFFDDSIRYALQTIKDNVNLLNEEALIQFNVILVNHGHRLINVEDKDLHTRCDSFVVERDVHFPTDISLLYDAMRKAITVTAQACDRFNLTDWRQYLYNIKQIKRQFRIAQQSKKSKDNSKIVQAHQDYLNEVQKYFDKLRLSIEKFDKFTRCGIQTYLAHAERQIQQIHRRVIEGKEIDTSEKVYSIFEPDTEWVNKGKAGNKIELGIKISIMEDQHQFILHHRVMRNEADADITVDMIKAAQIKFNHLESCSFDKGFYSKANLKDAQSHIALVVMPKKGKLNQQEKQLESTPEFIQTRHQHSAVESAINCLEQHGLDRCPDKGRNGFDRYVALAILAHNIQRIGELVQKKKRKQRTRRQAALAQAA